MEVLLARLEGAASLISEDYEIILVNDGSEDSTWQLIHQAAAEDRRIIGVDLSRNHGHQLAISAGLQFSGGAAVLIIDADLQDPPEILPEMMRIMKQEAADVVYGQRKRRVGVPFWKRASYFLFYRILRVVSGCEIPVDTGDFRLISRRVVDVLLAMPEQQRFLRGMISWLGFKQVAFVYERQARQAGEPKYTFVKLFQLAWDGIMSFSVFPLRIALIVGVLTASLSMCAAIYLICLKILFQQIPPGWTSIMVLILFVFGLQLLVLGLIGEYLGRVFLEIKRRPLFLVREVTNSRPSLSIPEPSLGSVSQILSTEGEPGRSDLKRPKK